MDSSPTPAPPRRSFPTRSLGWLAVLAVAGVFVYLNRGEWHAIGGAAQHARVRYLVLAAVLQLGWLVAFATGFWGAFRAIDVRLPYPQTLALAWGSNFLNMIVKTGGMGGMPLFLRAAAARGYASSRAALGYLIVLGVGHGEFMLLLGLGMALLWLRGEVRLPQIVAAIATFAVVAAVAAAAATILSSVGRTRAVYGALARTLNRIAGRFRRGPVLDPDGDVRTATEVRDVLTLLRQRPARLTVVLGADLIKEACAVAIFYAVLRAFDPEASLALAVIAYVTVILFSLVSIVPSGIGVVELSLTALLVQAGVPVAEATLTAVVYRLFEFWTPFLVGAIAVRFAGTPAKPSPAATA